MKIPTVTPVLKSGKKGLSKKHRTIFILSG